MLEYQAGAFVAQANRDRAAATARASIQSILQQFEWPTETRNMRIFTNLIYANAYSPCLLASVLFVQIPVYEFVSFLGHNRRMDTTKLSELERNDQLFQDYKQELSFRQNMLGLVTPVQA